MGEDPLAAQQSNFTGALQAVLIICAPEPAISLGRVPVIINGHRCTISAQKPPAVIHEPSGLNWQLESRDWCLSTAFSDQDHQLTALDSALEAVGLIDRALEGWNHASAWLRARDRATSHDRISPWIPRLGRVHVKAAALSDSRGHLATWVNPHKGGVLAIGGLLPTAEMLMTNGPAANPLPAFTNRLQDALDLLNHGFVTEALLSTFATFEAHLRFALSDAMRRAAGETLLPDRSVLSTVRSSNLQACVEKLATGVGWVPLSMHSADLAADLREVARARNQLVHQGASISRSDVEFGIDRLWAATAWLASQNDVEPLSLLPASNVAVPTLHLWRPGDPRVTTGTSG